MKIDEMENGEIAVYAAAFVFRCAGDGCEEWCAVQVDGPARSVDEARKSAQAHARKGDRWTFVDEDTSLCGGCSGEAI